MRIAQLAPLAESVPPKLYGGTERVISWLTEELVTSGHQVTLFASGDSQTSATLVRVWPRALRLARPRADPVAAHAVLLECLAEQAGNFDIIHSHIDWIHLPLFRRLGVPFLTTPHGRLDVPGFSTASAILQMHPLPQFPTISAYRSAGQIGLGPSITACRPICSVRPSRPGAIWRSLAASVPRKGRKLPSGSPVQRVCRFKSRRKCRAVTRAISKSELNR